MVVTLNAWEVNTIIEVVQDTGCDVVGYPYISELVSKLEKCVNGATGRTLVNIPFHIENEYYLVCLFIHTCEHISFFFENPVPELKRYLTKHLKYE